MEKIYIDNGTGPDMYCMLDYPKVCPKCGEKMFPKNLTKRMQISFDENFDGEEEFYCYMIYQCSISSCHHVFIRSYQIKNKISADGKYGFAELPSYTVPPVNTEIPEKINEVSSDFLSIYSEALKAESIGLKQISGVGFRKSLEFLVKDYLCWKNTDETKYEGIKKAALGTAIHNYLQDQPDLQNLATLSTWIGNSETHYIREYSDDDVQSMKSYIRAFASLVISQITIKEATDRVNQERSPDK